MEEGEFEFWDLEADRPQTLCNLCLQTCAGNSLLSSHNLQLSGDIEKLLTDARTDLRLLSNLEYRVANLASDVSKDLVLVGSGHIGKTLWKKHRSRPKTRWLRRVADLKQDAVAKKSNVRAIVVVAADRSEQPHWTQNLQLVNFAVNGYHSIWGSLNLLMAAAVPFQDESSDCYYLLLDYVDRYHDRNHLSGQDHNTKM